MTLRSRGRLVYFDHREAPDNFLVGVVQRRKPFWVWLAEEYDALEVIEMLGPWLSGRRHAQALDLAPLEAILLDAARQ